MCVCIYICVCVLFHVGSSQYTKKKHTSIGSHTCKVLSVCMPEAIANTYLYIPGLHLAQFKTKFQITTLEKGTQGHLLGYRILFINQRTETALAKL